MLSARRCILLSLLTLCGGVLGFTFMPSNSDEALYQVVEDQILADITGGVLDSCPYCRIWTGYSLSLYDPSSLGCWAKVFNVRVGCCDPDTGESGQGIFIDEGAGTMYWFYAVSVGNGEFEYFCSGESEPCANIDFKVYSGGSPCIEYGNYFCAEWQQKCEDSYPNCSLSPI